MTPMSRVCREPGLQTSWAKPPWLLPGPLLETKTEQVRPAQGRRGGVYAGTGLTAGLEGRTRAVGIRSFPGSGARGRRAPPRHTRGAAPPGPAEPQGAARILGPLPINIIYFNIYIFLKPRLVR